MSKPEDIPQDVWEQARELHKKVVMDPRVSAAETIARAVLAAKAEENEECAALVEDQDSWASRFETANAIRKRIADQVPNMEDVT